MCIYSVYIYQLYFFTCCKKSNNLTELYFYFQGLCTDVQEKQSKVDLLSDLATKLSKTSLGSGPKEQLDQLENTYSGLASQSKQLLSNLNGASEAAHQWEQTWSEIDKALPLLEARASKLSSQKPGVKDGTNLQDCLNEVNALSVDVTNLSHRLGNKLKPFLLPV